MESLSTIHKRLESLVKKQEELDCQLIKAMMHKNIESAIDKIRRGADPSLRVFQQPLLHFALKWKSDSLLRCCVEHGADLDAADADGKPLLHAAIEVKYFPAMDLLYGKVDVNRPCGKGWTPLFYALLSPNMIVVNELLQKGADVNVQNEDGDTPLHFAVNKNPLHWLARLLLDNGACVRTQNNAGVTALEIVLTRSREDLLDSPYVPIIRDLVKAGASFDEKYKFAINILASDPDYDINTLRRVLQETNCINYKDEEKRTPLYFAFDMPGHDMFDLFLDMGGKMDDVLLHKRHRSKYGKKMQAKLFSVDGETPSFVRQLAEKSTFRTNYHCFMNIISYFSADDCLKLHLATIFKQ